MKKLLVGLFLLFSTAAHAGVPCSVPFNLTNGTTADASQVMANYNAILACLANNTAASGNNNDITALLALTTPIPPAGGGTSSFTGSSVSGTNTIVVAATIPAAYTLTTPGQKIRFIAIGANTAATTLAVSASPQENFYRQTPAGPQPMVGGEIVAGQAVEAEWDGTQYQMISQPALGHAPGEVFDYAGAACPVGSIETTGSTVISQTAFSTLYANITTLWGAATGGNFTIPDLRGRTTFSRDSGGSGRITSAGGNFDGTIVGNTGGQQNATLTSTAQLPPYTPSGTIGGSFGFGGNVLINPSGSTGGGSSGPDLGSNSGISSIAGSSFSFTGASVGSSSPFATLSNAAIVLKCIKG